MILTDTGFWIALVNPKDQFHEISTALLSQLEEPLITTWPVMTETCHLLTQRIGTHAQIAFIESYQRKLFQIFEIPSHSMTRIQKLMKKYENLPMDLADASLVIAAEELGEGRILSTDQRDFQSYRWKNHSPFQNLLTMQYN